MILPAGSYLFLLYMTIFVFHYGMTTLSVNPKVPQYSVEEERSLSSFTHRLIEIGVLANARGSDVSAIEALNRMLLPAIAVDRYGLVIDINAAANATFDREINVTNHRVFVRDPESRLALKAALSGLTDPSKLNATIVQPIIVHRSEKLPILLRIWPYEGAALASEKNVHALITLNALGPKPGPPPAILARAFNLTPSEAKLASIIARGTTPATAAKELKISKETVRNRLKSIFVKTDTHRQSELVALLRQVE